MSMIVNNNNDEENDLSTVNKLKNTIPSLSAQNDKIM